MSNWIKMGTGLASHGKVKALRRSLKADRLRVVGGLWAVWCVFDEHSASGLLEGYTLDDMDEEIGWKGFSAAMCEIGWLIQTDDGLQAPDYEEHNGPNAKRRALDASRKGKTRAKADTEAPDDGPPVPPETRTPIRDEAGQMSASDADTMRNREEKRREEKKEGERAREIRAAAASPPSRGSRLPAGWSPGPEQDAFAEGLGFRNGAAQAELAKFRDYWAAQPGEKGRKADWIATWRNWLRRASEDRARRPAQAAAAFDLDGVH